MLAGQPHWAVPPLALGGTATAQGDVSLCQLCQVWQQLPLPCPLHHPLPRFSPPGPPFWSRHQVTQRGLGNSNSVEVDMVEQKNLHYAAQTRRQKKYNAYIKPSRSEAQELPIVSVLSNLTVHISSPPGGEGELAPSWAVTSAHGCAFLLLQTWSKMSWV